MDLNKNDYKVISLDELQETGGYLYKEKGWIYVIRDCDGVIIGVVDNRIKEKALKKAMNSREFCCASTEWITLDDYIRIYCPDLIESNAG